MILSSNGRVLKVVILGGAAFKAERRISDLTGLER